MLAVDKNGFWAFNKNQATVEAYDSNEENDGTMDIQNFQAEISLETKWIGPNKILDLGVAELQDEAEQCSDDGTEFVEPFYGQFQFLIHPGIELHFLSELAFILCFDPSFSSSNDSFIWTQKMLLTVIFLLILALAQVTLHCLMVFTKIMLLST